MTRVGKKFFLVVGRSVFLNVAFFQIGSRRDSLAQTGFAPFGKGVQLLSGYRKTSQTGKFGISSMILGLDTAWDFVPINQPPF